MAEEMVTYSFLFGRVRSRDHENALLEVAHWLDKNKFSTTYSTKHGFAMFDVSAPAKDFDGPDIESFKEYSAQMLIYALSRALGAAVTGEPDTEFDQHGNCPKCGASWDGGDIYEVLRAMDAYASWSDADLRKMVEESYSPPRRFSRLVGLEYRQKYDGVLEWQCPDCNEKWPRFLPKGVSSGKTGSVR